VRLTSLRPHALIAHLHFRIAKPANEPGCPISERALCVRCGIPRASNPPHVVPLVEVVGGKLTSAENVTRAVKFYARIGKKPIRMKKEMKGHIANRIQAAVFREVLYWRTRAAMGHPRPVRSRRPIETWLQGWPKAASVRICFTA
jgi:3-hydroxyacyl-CoA dehydrogenase, NAD binding domain